MAKPIKETPILRDEDARRFNELVRRDKNKKVPDSRITEIRSAMAEIRFLDTPAATKTSTDVQK